MSHSRTLNKKTFIIFAVAAVIIVVAAILATSLKKPSDGGAKEAVENSIIALEETWGKVYDEIGELFDNGTFRAPGSENRIVEIKGVRAVKLAPNENEFYKNVSYVVEFELYSNRYRVEPYFVAEEIYNTVLVYADGRCEVMLTNPITSSIEQSDPHEIHAIIENIEEFDSEFDKKITLK